MSNLVPRTNEGQSLGTSLKKWLKGWFKDIFVSNNITDGSNSVTVANIVNKGKIYIATGNTDISTSSDAFVDMTDMSIAQTFNAGDKLLINFNTTIRNSNASVAAYVLLLINGVEKMRIASLSGYDNQRTSCSLVWVEDITTTGSYTLKIQWASRVSGYDQYQDGATYKRILTIITGG